MRQRLGDAVQDLVFDRAVLLFPAPSPQHDRQVVENTLAPVAKLVAALQDEPARPAAFRSELEGMITQNLKQNMVRQHDLLTRATKT